MTAREALAALFIPRDEGDQAELNRRIDAVVVEVLAEAATTQRTFAAERWTPRPDAATEARRKASRTLGAAERLIALIDPNPQAPRPRHVRVYPRGGGFTVAWQLGDETESTHKATRVQADAYADELRAVAAAGLAEKGTCEGESTRAQVLREAADISAELIAGVSRTDSDAFARVDSFTAYSDRLHEIADEQDGGPVTAPGFFRPGRTYRDPGQPRNDWQFRCDTITTRPDDGERVALGWRFFKGEWETYSYAEDDWEIYQAAGVMATEGGEPRG